MAENIVFPTPSNQQSESLVVQLCTAGTQAEFQGRIDDASQLYIQAWQAVSNDYEACIAAHYVARFQKTLAETLRWNLTALHHAKAAGDERVKDFYPSLYLNIGRSYELLGNETEAQKYYALAAALGVVHQDS